jgi:hypothetical protein
LPEALAVKPTVGATLVASALVLCLTGGATAQLSSVVPQTPELTTAVASPAISTSDALVELNGIARTTTNAAVPFAPLRLRDARTGHIVGVTTSDQNGVFTFGSVRPGFYVVEITDNAGRVLATSPLISANAGDVIATLVKLPARFLVGGFFNAVATGAGAGGSMAGASAGAIAAVTSAAASAGVLAVTITGRPISPEQ